MIPINSAAYHLLVPYIRSISLILELNSETCASADWYPTPHSYVSKAVMTKYQLSLFSLLIAKMHA